MKLVLDLTFIKSICDDDQSFVNDVLDTFLKEMPKDITQMNQAIKDQDVVTIRRMAHKTKSSLQTLGLFELKELALKIEQLTKIVPADLAIFSLSKQFIKYMDAVYPKAKNLIR